MEFFASTLLQHAQMKAAGAKQDDLQASAQEVRRALEGLDPIGQQVEIGEHLTAHLLNYAIKNFSSCDVTITGDSATLSAVEEIQKAQLANFATAVFCLDGAYGISAGEIMSVIARYLEEIKK